MSSDDERAKPLRGIGMRSGKAAGPPHPADNFGTLTDGYSIYRARLASEARKTDEQSRFDQQIKVLRMVETRDKKKKPPITLPQVSFLKGPGDDGA